MPGHISPLWVKGEALKNGKKVAIFGAGLYWETAHGLGIEYEKRGA